MVRTMKTYVISDGAFTETASSLTDATEICERWCNTLQAEGRLPAPLPPNLDGSNLTSLNASITAWAQEVATQIGIKVSEFRVTLQEV